MKQCMSEALHSAECETLLFGSLGKGEFKNSTVDCFCKGDDLGKRLSPCYISEKISMQP